MWRFLEGFSPFEEGWRGVESGERLGGAFRGVAKAKNAPPSAPAQSASTRWSGGFKPLFPFITTYFRRVLLMNKLNGLTLKEFLQDLADLTHQPELWRSVYPPIHVFLEPSTASRRPTAIVIAVELQPALLILSTLEDEVADRYLTVGRQTWPSGMNSEVKRQVSLRIETLLMAYGVEGFPLPSKPMRALEAYPTRARRFIQRQL